MSGPSAAEVPVVQPVAVDAVAAAGSRGRWRLLALGILVAFWLAPWAQMQAADGSTFHEAWRSRTGAEGGIALVAMWGIAATTLAAVTRRGFRVGAALTDAAVALATTALLVLRHAWIPGGEVREAWVPMFGPLALLAALDAFESWRRPEAGGEVSVIRGGAALFAAASLAVDAAWIPAGVALWLGASPIAFLLARTAAACRRVAEALVLSGAVAALAAPTVHDALFGEGRPVVELVVTRYGWFVAALAVAATAVVGLVAPAGEAARPPAGRA